MTFAKRIASILLAFITLVVSAESAFANPTESWAWKYRVLAVFAPDHQSAELAKQRDLLVKYDNELKSRDMVVVEIIGPNAKSVFGDTVKINSAEIRSHANKSNDDFEVMLFGKDTGRKLRSAKPVSVSELFSLVDSMPMRKREMREQGVNVSP